VEEKAARARTRQLRARGARMISILGLDLDACMIRFLVSISMHAAGRAAAWAAATVVFSPFWDLAAMHTGGGSGRSAEAGDGSECSLSMRMRLSCHAVSIMRMRLGEGGVLESHVPLPFEVITTVNDETRRDIPRTHISHMRPPWRPNPIGVRTCRRAYSTSTPRRRHPRGRARQSGYQRGAGTRA